MFMTVERSRAARVLPAFDAGLRGKLKQAIDVEQLLQWTYADQAVTGRSVEIAGKADGALGGGGGGTRGATYSDGDALVVQSYVELLGPAVRVAVEEHALARSRPDWGAAMKLYEVRPQTVDAAGHQRGKPVVVRDRGNRPLYCPIQTIDRTDLRAARRVAYVDWWNAISVVGRSLREDDVLKRWLPVGPGAPALPWEA